jgi:hypothetical protein
LRSPFGSQNAAEVAVLEVGAFMAKSVLIDVFVEEVVDFAVLVKVLVVAGVGGSLPAERLIRPFPFVEDFTRFSWFRGCISELVLTPFESLVPSTGTNSPLFGLSDSRGSGSKNLPRDSCIMDQLPFQTVVWNSFWNFLSIPDRTSTRPYLKTAGSLFEEINTWKARISTSIRVIAHGGAASKEIQKEDRRLSLFRLSICFQLLAYVSKP